MSARESTAIKVIVIMGVFVFLLLGLTSLGLKDLVRTSGAKRVAIDGQRAGIPAVNVIDFSYGGSEAEHRQNWHTANDTIERVCAESLQVVGDVIYHALPLVDAYLDNPMRD